MLHTIRQIVDNDERWRGILRGAQKTFRHQTIMGSQLEDYISKESGTDLGKVFTQYLRTTMIPRFEYRTDGAMLSYHWANVVPGFDMPLRIAVRPRDSDAPRTDAWQTMRAPRPRAPQCAVDENWTHGEERRGGAAGSGTR